MPGTKRKVDEDTWIVSQSKKFKASSLLSNVYARTLAQLRMGARRFFNQNEENTSIYDEKENEGVLTTSPTTSPPGSPLTVQDVISHNELSPVGGVRQRPRNVCDCCRGKREDAWESCYFCDEVVCHVNPCVTCNYVFCSNCSLAKYDSPDGESYACYGCRS